MRKSLLILVAAALVLSATPALAELQNVQITGDVRIRGNYYTNVVGGVNKSNVRWLPGFLPGRAIGSNGAGVLSGFGFDDAENSTSFVEHRTRLGAKADFTDEVSAYIELDAYDIWGEDFRSNYVTGADFVTATNDDVEVYQSYIQADEMFGLPLSVRIGRQEISLGSEWLVGVNDTSSAFTGLSFDGIVATYATDMFAVSGLWAKLVETSPAEEDGDVDLYGVYASYLGLEDITIDAYWMLVRDARSINDTNFIWLAEWVEDWVDVDDYDVTNVHTVGLRGAGTVGALDFEAEVAYQFGDADVAGSLFTPFTYGDDGADVSEWAGNLEVGYTFDMAWQPRVFVGGAYFGGEDNRDLSFWDWINPFDRPQASVSFNRLFSNWEYSEFLANTELSNVWLVRGGVNAMPTESIELTLIVTYFETLEEFDAPAHFTLGRYRVPIMPAWSFWTDGNDNDLGIEVGLYATYHYTEDLTFEAGWAHLFVGDGLDDGNFSAFNGLGFNGGTNDDDSDYLYVETRIAF